MFKNLESTLSASLIGRQAEVRSLLRAAIAQEHCFLFGPPGTAKTLLLESFGSAFDARVFSILMGRFTTPEEVFGPNRITKLKVDEYERNLTGRFAEAEFVLADEIWKASNAILNNFLRAMNERKIENGVVNGKINTIHLPLRMMTAASNEFPERGELDALYDRFLVRRIVQPVKGNERHSLLFGKFTPVQKQYTLAELDQAHKDAMALEFDSSAQDAFITIWKELEKNGTTVGDRRAMKSLKICKAEAYLKGAVKVYPDHLVALEDVLWSSQDDLGKVREVVLRHCNPEQIILNEFIMELDSMSQNPSTDLTIIVGRMEKLDDMLKKMQRMSNSTQVQVAIGVALDERDKVLSASSGCTIEQARSLREAELV